MSIESARKYANGLAENLRETVIADDYEALLDWLEGVLDYQVTYNSQRELVSVRVLVSFGGPNAWIVFDGRHATVQASWYSEVVEVFVPDLELSGLVFDHFDQVLIG